MDAFPITRAGAHRSGFRTSVRHPFTWLLPLQAESLARPGAGADSESPDRIDPEPADPGEGRWSAGQRNWACCDRPATLFETVFGFAVCAFGSLGRLQAAKTRSAPDSVLAVSVSRMLGSGASGNTPASPWYRAPDNTEPTKWAIHSRACSRAYESPTLWALLLIVTFSTGLRPWKT